MSIELYILIGAMFTWGVDMASYHYKVGQLNNFERIACVLAWPLALLAFIWGYINSNDK